MDINFAPNVDCFQSFGPFKMSIIIMKHHQKKGGAEI